MVASRWYKLMVRGSPVYSDPREGSGRAILRKREKRSKCSEAKKGISRPWMEGENEPPLHPSGFSARTGRRLALIQVTKLRGCHWLTSGKDSLSHWLSSHCSGESIKNCKLATQGPKTNVSATFQSTVLPQNVQYKFHCSQMVLLFLSSLLETLCTSLFPNCENKQLACKMNSLWSTYPHVSGFFCNTDFHP